MGFLFRIVNRSLLAFLAPYALLIVGYLALEFIHSLSVNQLATLRLVPYSLFIVSACISLYFGRSRIFYLSIVMALMHWALTSYYPYRAAPEQTLLLLVLGVLAPINLATPMLLCTCIWLKRSSTISIGSSTVQTLISGRASCFSVE